MDDQYTWKQFKDAVLDLLTVDKDRDGTSTFRDLQLRQGVIHLQSLIPQFQLGHESIYHAQDVVGEGYSSRGTKPPMSAIRDVWLVNINSDDKTCFRYPLEIVSWDNRFSMVNGNESTRHRAAFAIDPQGGTFYVYPEVKGRWLLSMFWDGQKLDFEDSDAVPFTESAVGAVAEFLKAKMVREYEKNIALHDSYMASFKRAIPLMVIEAKDRSRVMNTSGEGGGVKCGGRTVCNTLCSTPSLKSENPIIFGNGDPSTATLVGKDRTVGWLYKDLDSGALWIWHAATQTWI